ncbi:uncharacterized protein METZ01_LOCUS391314, partial [marine metagenome]
VENFLVKKKHRKIRFFFDHKKFDQLFFDQQFFDPQNIFDQKLFSTKMFLIFLSTKKYPITKIWLPIPMRNFPKIPKITLRTACEHSKNS